MGGSKGAISSLVPIPQVGIGMGTRLAVSAKNSEYSILTASAVAFSPAYIIVLKEQWSVLRVSQDTAAVQLKKDEAGVTVELTLLTSCPHSILDWI